MKYVVIFEKAPNNYGAYVPDLPGCVALADTLEETEELIREAIQYHIEFMVSDGDPVEIPSAVGAAVVDVEVPEDIQWIEPEYPLLEPEEHTDAAEVAD